MRWRVVSSTIALVVVLASPSLETRAQTPSFRTRTDLVPVFATVLDSSGHVVPDLTAGDFEILDEGKPQVVSLFSIATQPAAIVVALDTSLSATLAIDSIRRAATDFVLRLWPRDVGAICAFNDRIRFGTGLTGDAGELAKAIRDIDFGNGSRLYDALAASVARLEHTDARRVIVVFTDGYDTSSRRGLKNVIARARAADVTIYGIGLNARRLDDADDGWNDDWEPDWDDAGPDPGVRRIALETGGSYIELERAREIPSTFTHIADELHVQYVVAFSPAVRDGRVHKLSIRVHRRGVQVRARRTYLALSP